MNKELCIKVGTLNNSNAYNYVWGSVVVKALRY